MTQKYICCFLPTCLIMHWRRPRISFTTFCGNKMGSVTRPTSLVHENNLLPIWQVSQCRLEPSPRRHIQHLDYSDYFYFSIPSQRKKILMKWLISNKDVGPDGIFWCWNSVTPTILFKTIFISLVPWSFMSQFLVIYFCYTKDELSPPCLPQSNDALPKQPFVTHY